MVTMLSNSTVDLRCATGRRSWKPLLSRWHSWGAALFIRKSLSMHNSDKLKNLGRCIYLWDTQVFPIFNSGRRYRIWIWAPSSVLAQKRWLTLLWSRTTCRFSFKGGGSGGHSCQPHQDEYRLFFFRYNFFKKQNNVFSFRMRSLLFIIKGRLNNLLLFFVPLLLFWKSSPSVKDISFLSIGIVENRQIFCWKDFRHISRCVAQQGQPYMAWKRQINQVVNVAEFGLLYIFSWSGRTINLQTPEDLYSSPWRK